MEEGLKNASSFSHSPSAVSGAEKTGKSNNFVKTLSCNERKRSVSQPGDLVRKRLWASRNKVDGKENTETIVVNVDKLKEKETTVLGSVEIKEAGNVESGDDDMVSGFLYDKLQKEVITLRKSCEKKQSYLNARDEEIKVNSSTIIFRFSSFSLLIRRSCFIGRRL